MINKKQPSLWSTAMDLAIDVYTLVATGPISSNANIQHMIRSAAVSIPSSIAAAQSDVDYMTYQRHFENSMSSCENLKMELLAACEGGLVDFTDVSGVTARLDDIITALNRQAEYAIAV